MHIITVSPITRSVLNGHLSYFSKETAPIGSVVLVPVRNREIPALVVGVTDALNAKTTVKSSEFALRKITRLRPRTLWSNAFLHAAESTARYFAHEFGEVLLSLSPKTILDAYLDETLPTLNKDILSVKNTEQRRPETLAIQDSTRARIEAYQRLIRESFAQQKSVFICVPSPENVVPLARELGHGIESYTFSFANTLTKKRIIESWKAVLAEQHAILVIGTPQFLSIPRAWETIILDDEHSRSWKTVARPLLDMRVFAEAYAKELGAQLIFGAPILRPETHARIQSGSVGEFFRIASRARANTITEIIDPRVEEKACREKTGRRTLSVITERAKILIATALEKNEHVLLLSARKGLAPITACGDCGTAIRCPGCDSPLVLHRTKGKDGERRTFSCHSCGFIRLPEDDMNETCPACGSWRLEPLGIGTERIEDEVAKLFPEASRFVFDGDRVATPAQARALMTQFEHAKGGILVATPMAIPHLASVEHTVIVSLDSLFAIPDFRMNERIFTLILALREKTQSLLVQTRADDTTFIAQALEGDLAGFTENELAIRKVFSYPPYGTIVKISIQGKQHVVTEELAKLKTYLSEYEPIAPNSMTRVAEKTARSKQAPAKPQGLFRMHLIIKLAQDTYPDSTLIAKLRTLPPHMTVEINPDHLL